jgi:4-hydroxybenzoyl-CoA reductase subunit beta
MKQKIVSADYVVSLKRIEGLARIDASEHGLRIGAMATITEIHRSPLVRRAAPVLAEAALAVGATQLQNMGTLGGNLCLDTRCWYCQQTESWRAARAACLKLGGEICYMARASKRCYALYSGDTAAALLALGASVKLVSPRGERVVRLEDFFVDDGKRPWDLQPDEILAEVIVPAQPVGQLGTYVKFRRRGAIDFPIVGVAATLAQQRGICQHARIAITGVGSAPIVVSDGAAALVGQGLGEDSIDAAAEAAYRQARPVSSMEVSAAYRKRLVKVIVKDALSSLSVRTKS